MFQNLPMVSRFLRMFLSFSSDFPTIERLQANLKKLNQSMVAVHANYLSGNLKKKERMKEYGFWLSQAETNENMEVTVDRGCSEYIPYVVSAAAAAKAAEN